MHLTIIDDDPNNLEMYQDLLSTDFDLKLIQNPLELKDYIKENDTNLILLDFMMPQINGIDLYSIIKKDLKGTPVIFISSNPSDEAIIRGLDLGAEDFITRPISNSQLVCRINNRLRKKGKFITGIDRNIKNIFSLNDEFEAIFIEGKKYRLTTQEFKIISLLSQNTEKIHSLDDIKNTIWPDVAVSKHALATHLNNLKKKVPPLSKIFINKRGSGYYLEI